MISSMKKIDRNRLPAKYYLEVYKMVDGYPSTIDILYELVSALQAKSLLDSSFKLKDVIRDVSTRIPNEDLEVSLQKMAESGTWLEKKKDGVYQLVEHPWQEENQ
jgi:hypothetical protein